MLLVPHELPVAFFFILNMLKRVVHSTLHGDVFFY